MHAATLWLGARIELVKDTFAAALNRGFAGFTSSCAPHDADPLSFETGLAGFVLIAVLMQRKIKVHFKQLPTQRLISPSCFAPFVRHLHSTCTQADLKLPKQPQGAKQPLVGIEGLGHCSVREGAAPGNLSVRGIILQSCMINYRAGQLMLMQCCAPLLSGPAL